ncbi:MAG: hypothetical protein ACM3ML_35810 [Micromonosporaceae bacterium]
MRTYNDTYPAGCRAVLDCQQQVITRWQAVAAGISPAVIDKRLRNGSWQPILRGVYATYRGEPRRGSLLWAAVLRAGPSAVLSHQTAAELDGLAGEPDPVIHVTVPRDKHIAKMPGVVIHRCERPQAAYYSPALPPRTVVEETIFDLTQAAVSFDEAFGWLSRSCTRGFTTPQRLRTAMAPRKKMRWRGEIAAALRDIDAGVHSLVEYRHLQHIERAHGLPPSRRLAGSVTGLRSHYRAAVNEEFGLCQELGVGEPADVGPRPGAAGRSGASGVPGARSACLAFPRPRELAGQAAAPHDLQARRRDAYRGGAIAEGGLITLRYSSYDITERPCEVAAEVAAVLKRRGWSGTPRPCGAWCPISLAS